MDEYIGIIKLFAGNFAPRGWLFCQGQLLPIAQNQALFAILGTQYGGNGTTNFALPDLRGRTPMCFGQGPGLQPYTQGQTGGVENVTLTSPQLPTHMHMLVGSSLAATQETPTAGLLSAAKGSDNEGSSYTIDCYANSPVNTTMNAASISTAGGSQAHENRPPFMALNYIICSQGVFPPRS